MPSPAAVPHDPCSLRAHVDRGHRALLVREQSHSCRARAHARDGADEPTLVHDRVIDLHTVLRAGRDDDRLRERPGGTTDDLRGDSVEVVGEPWALVIVEQPAERFVLGGVDLAAGELLTKLLVLGLEALGLGACAQKPVEPRVAVSERLRDAVGRDLEGAEHACCTVPSRSERALVLGAERERHEDECEQDEHPHDAVVAETRWWIVKGAGLRRDAGRSRPAPPSARCGFGAQLASVAAPAYVSPVQPSPRKRGWSPPHGHSEAASQRPARTGLATT